MRPPAPENLLEKLKISGAEQGGSTVSGLVDVNVKKLFIPEANYYLSPKE